MSNFSAKVNNGSCVTSVLFDLHHQFQASYKEADSTTMPTTLAKAKKTVKVLEKQPNGSFMVSASAEEHSSPRTKRAANRKTQDQQV